MKISEIEVGRRYRVNRGAGARIRVLEKIPGGSVRVEIEAGSVWSGSKWTDPGAVQKMPARDLASTWADYVSQFSNATPPEPLTWTAQQALSDSRTLYAPVIDPDRPIPRNYESRWESDRNQLDAGDSEDAWNSVFAPRTRPGKSAENLLNGLPPAVARDLMAAFLLHESAYRFKRAHKSPLPSLSKIEDGFLYFHSEDPAADAPTVGETFKRAAQVLATAVDDNAGGLRHRNYPGLEVLTDDDAEFAAACATLAAGSTGPAFSDSFPPHLVSIVEPGLIKHLGWMPVAIGATTGRRLHRPGCHVLREHKSQLRDSLVMPLWYVALHLGEDLCGVCSGPIFAEPHSTAHFLLASDAWRVNGKHHVEQWQLACYARHFGAGTTAGVLSASQTRLTRSLVGMFGTVDHGEQGWNLYNALTYSAPQDGLTDGQRIELATTASRMLDDAMQLAGRQRGGWPSQDLANLESAGVPHAARIIFTLPSAFRA